MARSETILGRKMNRRAWQQRLAHNNKLTRQRWGFTVSAFMTRHGKMFYTDALQDYYSAYGASPAVLYRIRVYPKRSR